MKVRYENWRGIANKTFEEAVVGEIESDRDGGLERCQDEIRDLAKLVGRLIEHIAETSSRHAAEDLVANVLHGALEQK
jgi:hypothetical protein